MHSENHHIYKRCSFYISLNAYIKIIIKLYITIDTYLSVCVCMGRREKEKKRGKDRETTHGELHSIDVGVE